jgi:hypothetical protein
MSLARPYAFASANPLLGAMIGQFNNRAYEKQLS